MFETQLCHFLALSHCLIFSFFSCKMIIIISSSKTCDLRCDCILLPQALMVSCLSPLTSLSYPAATAHTGTQSSGEGLTSSVSPLWPHSGHRSGSAPFPVPLSCSCPTCNLRPQQVPPPLPGRHPFSAPGRPPNSSHPWMFSCQLTCCIFTFQIICFVVFLKSTLSELEHKLWNAERFDWCLKSSMWHILGQ